MKTLDINSFLSASHYQYPAEFKKLRLIFKTVSEYLDINKLDIKDLQILEFGCGRGNIALPLASLGCHVRCFDIHKETIEGLKHEVAIKGFKNLIATVDDVYTFDDGNKYHIVIVSEILEHVNEPKRLAEKIKNHLMPDSCLIVTIPNGYGPRELSERLLYGPLIRSNSLRKLFGRPKYIDPYPGYAHCQYFTRDELTNIINIPVMNFSKTSSILASLYPIDTRTKNHIIASIDVLLADILPWRLASGWYFEFGYSAEKKFPHKQ
jgi:2-polyprenyl-3-methyl-5-hydroxy-6-metoxy-1,4-benzoquinol methylase